jgi:predicted nucleic acid-binding protein
MPFVLDTSIACNWALKDEKHPTASLALKRAQTDVILVPALWWFEIRNALLVNERRKRVTESETRQFLAEIARLEISIDHAPDEEKILALARQHKLTVYDAAYVELALREKIPLATLDKELTAAAHTEKVELVGT